VTTFIRNQTGGRDSRASASFARSAGASSSVPLLDRALADLTARWERGEDPRAEEYFGRLGPGPPGEQVELIYREFRLAEDAGLSPEPTAFLTRFPEHGEALGRLFGVHDALNLSGSVRWAGAWIDPPFPVLGDEVGPYRLVGELGRGAFAHVFLAEQTDLDDRLVVVKISTKITPEPRLLARARHPHIVELLWHGEVDDGAFQVICMPFLGGASLTSVMAARRERGARPASGRDLLDDLDRASAAGYPPPRSGRPARELMAGLSFPRASAWVVARLAEALDHAYAKGVLHGDVKPSNVLLTADGYPMLLDFNLAVGWRPHAGRREAPEDVGGTLAYMAPERLSAVADPGGTLRPTASDRHRADIYSLGVVLLEVLTGRAPAAPGGKPQSLQELASAYVSSRRQEGGVLTRSAAASLPGGLRAILVRCLAPEPADRYARASELAEDLDLWRTDRALAYADEPPLSLGVVRLARRHRLILAAAVAGLAVAGAISAFAFRSAREASRAQASEFYARVLRGGGPGAFLARQPGSGEVKAVDDPAEIAKLNLDRYGVLDPGVDWRGRDNYRALPATERAELEAWMLEQALRFAHALGARPEAPGDWRRALLCLDRVATDPPLATLSLQASVLRRKLDLRDPPYAGGRSAAPTPPQWVEDYLLGVSAELREDAPAAAAHYETVLKQCPRSFWTNYRAAAVASRRGTDASAEANDPKSPLEGLKAEIRARRYFEDAARYLGECLARSPDNITLHRLLAGCRHGQGEYLEAAEEYDKVLRSGPGHAETYLLNSIVRLRLGQVADSQKDLARYEALTLGRARGTPAATALDLTPTDRLDSDFGGAYLGLGARPATAHDPDEFGVRMTLAYQHSQAGHHELALKEFDYALALKPHELRSRYGRAQQRARLKLDDAGDDFVRVTEHPRVELLVKSHPATVYAFPRAVSALLRRGLNDRAVQTAEKGVELTAAMSWAHFDARLALARALATVARTQPNRRGAAVEQLEQLRQIAPKKFQAAYANDSAFAELRVELGPEPFGALPAYVSGVDRSAPGIASTPPAQESREPVPPPGPAPSTVR